MRKIQLHWNKINWQFRPRHIHTTVVLLLLGVSRAAKLCGCLSIHVIASVRARVYMCWSVSVRVFVYAGLCAVSSAAKLMQ